MNMDKMKFETPNITAENVAKIAELFPGVVSEGKVNFDLLRTMLGDEISKDEAYEFTWVGKRAAIAEAGRPIRKTLRPVVQDETTPTGSDSAGKPYCSSGSRDWDTTENLYIEGDNLEVLKLLQESYLGKIKMIYIDPPYNTGNDFIYKDDFAKNKEEYDEEAGVYNEEGVRLFRNNKSNGRFHSDWCSMMYPRLVLARNLLSSDGVIFISIDDNECHNLRKMCDEVFGEANYFGCVSRATGTTTGQDANKIGSSLDYLLIYKKSPAFALEGITLSENDARRFSLEDGKGKYSILQLRKTGNADRRADRPNMYYPVISPEGKEIFPVGPTGYESRWRFGYSTYEEFLRNDMIVWQASQSGELMPYVKYYLEGRTKQVSNLWTDVEGNKKGTIDLKAVIGIKAFDNPKPISLLKKIITVSGVRDNDIVLDFFSGSATTAHAVMQLNAEDGGKRKFIMVQLPEVCAQGTEAAKAGYKNICEIGKERIRRAGKKIKAEAGLNGQDLDIGFRVLKVDDSNMNDVYYAAGDYTQDMLGQMEDNIKSDRTDLDLLFACLLDWGLPLSMPHTHETIDGFTVHTYNNGDLVACFDEHISEKAVREIASRQPLRAVFRDSSFTSSPEKINVFEIFKLLAPNTTVKVL
jgi:adenine-specific DNA-methyltransferase